MSDEKDPRRVEAGKKAAETRKQHEGDQVFSEMGKKGAESRGRGSGDSSGSSGRGDEEQEYTSKDAMADQGSSRQEDDQGKDPVRVEAGKKAAETRKEREGEDIFHKLGEKGAEARWGHGSTDTDRDNQQQE